MQNVKVNSEFILEFNKALEKSYRKEYDAILALYDNNKINRTTLKKYYDLSDSNSTAVLNFFDFINCNDKNLINAKPNNLSKIENNYLYKWFINFRDAYLTNKEKNTSKNKYIHITKEIVMKVKELLSLNIPQKEIKVKTEISLGSIYRIKKGIYDYMIENKQENNIEIKECCNNIDEKESDNTKEQKENNIEIKECCNNIDEKESDNTKEQKEKSIIYIPKEYDCRKKFSNDYIECGLIKYRHPMPVDLFIFNNTLLNNQILDYDYLDKTINKFIDTYVQFDNNGKALTSIKLYTTGLQSALASMIKICSYRKIELEVFHYDPIKNEYIPQKIFNFNNLDDIIHLKKGYKNTVFLYKCDKDQLKNADKIYECKLLVYSKNSFSDTIYRESTLSDNLNKILEFYNVIFSELLFTDYAKLISIRDYTKSKGLFKYNDQIIYTSNFSRSNFYHNKKFE